MSYEEVTLINPIKINSELLLINILSAVSLEDLVDAMIQYLLEYYALVYEKFRRRYLKFGKVNLNL